MKRSGGPSFGVLIRDAATNNTPGIPAVIEDCVEFFSKEKNLTHAGIFRDEGDRSTMARWREMYEQGHPCPFTSLSPDAVTKEITLTVAAFLKLYLKEMPQSLCTFGLYRMFANVGDPTLDANAAKEDLKSIVKNLPPDHILVLKYLICFWKMLISLSNNINNNIGISSRTLAEAFAPCILHPETITREDVLVLAAQCINTVQMLIDDGETVFDGGLTVSLPIPDTPLTRDSLASSLYDMENLVEKLIDNRYHRSKGSQAMAGSGIGRNVPNPQRHVESLLSSKHRDNGASYPNRRPHDNDNYDSDGNSDQPYHNNNYNNDERNSNSNSEEYEGSHSDGDGNDEALDADTLPTDENCNELIIDENFDFIRCLTNSLSNGTHEAFGRLAAHRSEAVTEDLRLTLHDHLVQGGYGEIVKQSPESLDSIVYLLGCLSIKFREQRKEIATQGRRAQDFEDMLASREALLLKCVEYIDELKLSIYEHEAAAAQRRGLDARVSADVGREEANKSIRIAQMNVDIRALQRRLHQLDRRLALWRTSRLKDIVFRWRNIEKLRAFAQWRAVVGTSHQLSGAELVKYRARQEKLKSIVNAWRTGALYFAWSRWRINIYQERAESVALAAASQLDEARSNGIHKRLGLIIGRWKERCIRSGFIGWREHVLLSHLDRQRDDMLDQFKKDRAILEMDVKSMEEWATQSSQKAAFDRLAVTLNTWNANKLRTGLYEWRAVVLEMQAENAKENMEKLLKLKEEEYEDRIESVIQEKLALAHDSLREDKLRVFATLWKQRQVRAVWLVWRLQASRGIFTKQVGRLENSLEIERSNLSHKLRSASENLESAKRSRALEKLSGVIRLWLSNDLTHGLHKWKLYVLVEKSERKASDILCQRQQLEQKFTQELSKIETDLGIARRAEAANKLCIVLGQWQSHRVRWAFSSWLLMLDERVMAEQRSGTNKLEQKYIDEHRKRFHDKLRSIRKRWLDLELAFGFRCWHEDYIATKESRQLKESQTAIEKTINNIKNEAKAEREILLKEIRSLELLVAQGATADVLDDPSRTKRLMRASIVDKNDPPESIVKQRLRERDEREAAVESQISSLQADLAASHVMFDEERQRLAAIRWTNRQLYQVFFTWKSQVFKDRSISMEGQIAAMRRQHAITLVIAKWCHQGLAYGFLTWRKALDMARERHAAVLRFSKAEEHYKMQRLKLFVQTWINSRLQRAFNSWRINISQNIQGVKDQIAEDSIRKAQDKLSTARRRFAVDKMRVVIRDWLTVRQRGAFRQWQAYVVSLSLKRRGLSSRVGGGVDVAKHRVHGLQLAMLEAEEAAEIDRRVTQKALSMDELKFRAFTQWRWFVTWFKFDGNGAAKAVSALGEKKLGRELNTPIVSPWRLNAVVRALDRWGKVMSLAHHLACGTLRPKQLADAAFVDKKALIDEVTRLKSLLLYDYPNTKQNTKNSPNKDLYVLLSSPVHVWHGGGVNAASSCDRYDLRLILSRVPAGAAAARADHLDPPDD